MKKIRLATILYCYTIKIKFDKFKMLIKDIFDLITYKVSRLLDTFKSFFSLNTCISLIGKIYFFLMFIPFIGIPIYLRIIKKYKKDTKELIHGINYYKKRQKIILARKRMKKKTKKNRG